MTGSSRKPQGPESYEEATCDATIYFDGSSPLCTAEINHYAGREGGDRLNFVDVSRPGSFGDDLAPQDAMRRFHVRLPDGTLVSGARGFIAVWERLPGWHWAARAARLPGVLPMLDAGYRIFLPLRPALSRIAALLGAKAANPRVVEHRRDI